MSLFDYRASREIAKTDPPFYALIMAAMSKADTMNAAALRRAFPGVWDEVEARYNAPGGILPTDPEAESLSVGGRPGGVEAVSPPPGRDHNACLPDLNRRLGEQIAAARKARRFSALKVAELAHGLGVTVHRVALSRIEKGEQAATVPQLIALAVVLDSDWLAWLAAALRIAVPSPDSAETNSQLDKYLIPYGAIIGRSVTVASEREGGT